MTTLINTRHNTTWTIIVFVVNDTGNIGSMQVKVDGSNTLEITSSNPFISTANDGIKGI